MTLKDIFSLLGLLGSVTGFILVMPYTKYLIKNAIKNKKFSSELLVYLLGIVLTFSGASMSIFQLLK
jgi:hypothetical protein